MADQQYGWQDDLFGDGQWLPGGDSNEEAKKAMHPFTLWPGVSKPGLWMYFVSKLATLARTCKPTPAPLPPVFNKGEFLLDRKVGRAVERTRSIEPPSTTPDATPPTPPTSNTTPL